MKLDGTTQATGQHYRDGFYERVETSRERASEAGPRRRKERVWVIVMVMVTDMTARVQDVILICAPIL